MLNPVKVIFMLVLLFCTSVSAAESNDPIHIYGKYEDAVAAAHGRLLILNNDSPVASGYSLLPFGSKQKAVNEATKKAAKLSNHDYLAYEDHEVTFSANTPPPGSFMGGVYYVYRIIGISYVTPTSAALLEQIKSNLVMSAGDLSYMHAQYLADTASNPVYSGLTPMYEGLIRENNSEYIKSAMLPKLVKLIALHEGAASTEEIKRWAKYHKNSEVRLSAYLALLDLGKTADVEDLLKTEDNSAIKEKIQSKLI